jgi:hypothetical protein
MRAVRVDCWRKANNPPFDSLHRFPGSSFSPGIIVRSAASPDPTKINPLPASGAIFWGSRAAVGPIAAKSPRGQMRPKNHAVWVMGVHL